MKIKISDVLISGIEYQDQASAKDLDIIEDFIDLESTIVACGRLARVDDFILAKLDVTYTIDTVCARCLDKIHGDITIKCDLDFEFDPGDKYIDIGERIREEILVGYQPHTLCREDCKGICPDCGAYLNEEECECKTRNNK